MKSYPLDSRQVALFLLNRLRRAKQNSREYRQRNASLEIMSIVQAYELEANNCYYAFLENLFENQVIPALHTPKGFTKAKTLFWDNKPPDPE